MKYRSNIKNIIKVAFDRPVKLLSKNKNYNVKKKIFKINVLNEKNCKSLIKIDFIKKTINYNNISI